MNNGQRDIRYDIIRVVAILFVVCIHSFHALFDGVKSDGLVAGVDVCISTAVPLFVMLSGALLLGRREPISAVYRHRLPRILLPFLFWSVIVYGAFYFIHHQGFTLQALTQCLKGYCHDLVKLDLHQIYWFVYMMAGLYLLLPLLRIVVQSGRQAFHYLLLLVTCGLVLGKCFPQSAFVALWDNQYFTWVFLFLSGYKAVTWQSASGKAFGLISTLSFVALFALSYWLQVRGVGGGLCDLANMAYYVSAFCFLLAILPGRSGSRAVTGAVTSLSRMSYGIYLCHILFVSLYLRLLSGVMMPGWLMFVCVVALAMASSVVVLTALAKMGLGKLVQ